MIDKRSPFFAYRYLVTPTSETDTAKTYIERKKTEKYSDEELQNISDKLNSMHNLESREDEDEQN